MNKRIEELFCNLDKQCVYIILRNWDEIFEEDLSGLVHNDIDILCESLESFIKATGAIRICNNRHRDNFVVIYNSLRIRFDVRWIGDGYYPINWERQMLKRRVKLQSGLFVPSEIDYYYSLIYHSLLQKPILSKEYNNKLQRVYNRLYSEDCILSTDYLINDLKLFLDTNNFIFIIPQDPAVYLNWGNIIQVRYKIKIRPLLRRFLYRRSAQFFSVFHIK